MNSRFEQTYFDCREAASYLKIKVGTLYAWVHQRKIPYRKHGRKLVFSQKELDLFSENHFFPAQNF